MHEWELPLLQLDAALTEEEREAAAIRLATEEHLRPFDLSREIPLRTQLIQLDQNDHVLLATLHHIASDGWSLGVLTRELRVPLRGVCERPSRRRLRCRCSMPTLPVGSASGCELTAWRRSCRTGVGSLPRLPGIGFAHRPSPAQGTNPRRCRCAPYATV